MDGICRLQFDDHRSLTSKEYHHHLCFIKHIDTIKTVDHEFLLKQRR